MKRKYISALVGLGAAAVIAVPGVASASTTAVQTHQKPATTQFGWWGNNGWGNNGWGNGGWNNGWGNNGWGQNNWWFRHHHHHHWGW
jgi:hypothetical protein